MTPSDAPSDSIIVSRFNRILAIAIWVIAAGLCVMTLLGDGSDRALAIVPAVFFGLFAWTVLWRPYVRVDDTGVRLRNVLSTVDVPWASLIHVDTRYALTLYTPGHKYSAWAAPAPGRTGTSMARRAETHGRVDATPAVDGKVRPGDLLASESGQAAYLVRERWNLLLDSGAVEPGVADATPVTVRWHWWLDLALAVLAVGAIFALLAL